MQYLRTDIKLSTQTNIMCVDWILKRCHLPTAAVLMRTTPERKQVLVDRGTLCKDVECIEDPCAPRKTDLRLGYHLAD